MDITPAQERYCQERAKGATQRRAYLAAFPGSQKWKPETVDKRACELEAKRKVAGRLRELQKAAAAAAVVTRAEIVGAQAMLLRKGVEAVERHSLADRELAPAVKALADASDRLMAWLPEEEGEERPEFVRDFALLVAPPFLAAHRAIDAGLSGDYWFGGGRGSTKSSFCSLQVVKWLERHPDQHAVVLMKRKADLRDAAYAQTVWAIRALGLADAYDMPESTLRITRRATGQKIIFRGCDNASKIKSLKVPFGHVGITWFEEADQFAGMAEIRKVNQSLTRGGDDCVRLYSFNPPRSARCWVNAEMERREAAGLPVFRSTYLDVPPEWLGGQFIEDAESLRAADERAYRHEYLGEPVGIGTEVFDNVTFRAITDDEVAQFERLRFGQDFGWYPDPWAITGSEWRPGGRALLTFCEDGANRPSAAGRCSRGTAATGARPTTTCRCCPTTPTPRPSPCSATTASTPGPPARASRAAWPATASCSRCPNGSSTRSAARGWPRRCARWSTRRRRTARCSTRYPTGTTTGWTLPATQRWTRRAGRADTGRRNRAWPEARPTSSSWTSSSRGRQPTTATPPSRCTRP